jgi:hypothetical protein
MHLSRLRVLAYLTVSLTAIGIVFGPSEAGAATSPISFSTPP